MTAVPAISGFRLVAAFYKAGDIRALLTAVSTTNVFVFKNRTVKTVIKIVYLQRLRRGRNRSLQRELLTTDDYSNGRCQ